MHTILHIEAITRLIVSITIYIYPQDVFNSIWPHIVYTEPIYLLLKIIACLQFTAGFSLGTALMINPQGRRMNTELSMIVMCLHVVDPIYIITVANILEHTEYYNSYFYLVLFQALYKAYIVHLSNF